MPITLLNKKRDPAEDLRKRQEAQVLAAAQAAKARVMQRFTLGRCVNWQQVSDILNFDVSELYRKEPFIRETVVQYLDWYVATSVARELTKFDEQQAAAKQALELVQKNNIAFAKVKLRPQQKKALDQMIEAYKQGCKAVMVAMGTGRGKTIVFGAFLQWLKDNGKLAPNVIYPQGLVCTKKPVVLATREKIEKFFDILTTGDSMPNYDAEAGVYHYSTFGTKKHTAMWKKDRNTGEPLFDAVDVYGSKVFYPQCGLAEPINVAVLDECHELKKMTSKRTRHMRGILSSKAARQCFWIFASATPAVCLNDTRLFNLAAGFATEETMAAFLGRFGTDASKPDNKAMKKYNDFLGIHLVRPPEDKLSYKIRNRIDIVEFPSPAAEHDYREAEAKYVQAVEASGGTVGDLQMAQFVIFRRADELIKAPIYADYMCRERAAGRAPVLAVCFIETVLEVCSILASRGWTRDELSLIWGGQKLIEASDCFTSHEMSGILTRAKTEQANYLAEFGTEPEDEYFFLSRKEKAKFKRTREFNKSRLRRGQTKLEQNTRVAWLKQFELDKQTDVERHKEVKRFLADETLGCIFTFSAGGTGIDLDNQIEGGRPRTLIATICYWAEEFLQAFGRCARIMTKSDVEHVIPMFNNTITVAHVLPRLEPKLRSIKTLTGIDGDLEDILAAEIVKRKGKSAIAQSVSAETDELPPAEEEEDDDDDE
jgi:hypothetical protein